MPGFVSSLFSYMSLGLVNSLLYVNVSLGSLVSLILGVIYTIRSSNHYKTIKRPWLLIVIGLALPVVVYIILQLILWAAH